MRRDTLPVVAESYRLAQDLIPAIDRMPRGLRSILGGELLRELVGLSACLHEASLHGTRADALRRADVHLTRTRVVVRMAFDQHALSAGIYETACGRADEVGKMLGGWLRSVSPHRTSPGKDSGAPPSGRTGEAGSSS